LWRGIAQWPDRTKNGHFGNSLIAFNSNAYGRQTLRWSQTELNASAEPTVG
jgi:hypothetical protein